MDQVKVYLAILKKRHFWVLCGLFLIVAPLSCRMGASHFSAEYDTRKTALNSTFTKIGGIASEADHPNDSFVTGVAAEHQKLTEQVIAAWKKFYEQQQGILTWPDEFSEIAKKVADHNPQSGTPPDISQNLCERYMNYAKDNVPELFKIINLRRSGKDDEGVVAAEDGVVVWDGAKNVVERYSWSAAPTPMAVLFAQEDYWVYKALLSIIARTNGDDAQFYNAAIKRIIALDIAQAAAGPRPSDKLKTPQGTPLGGGGGGGAGPTKVPDKSSADADLASGRYVDAQGNPITGGGAPTGEFKRMPVYMQLVMDQRKIPQLLAECANSPLLVEVDQVSFRSLSARAAPTGEGQNSGSRPARPTAQPTGGGGADASTAKGEFDVTVDIWGVIYIYNRPDESRLQPSQVAQNY